jgi:acetylornithine deacetylase/succinyl-diaminopimelate desuccinylase-like protein
MGLKVDIDRLMSDITTLSSMGSDSRGGITRQAYTPEYQQATTWLADAMAHIGMETRIDGAGNLIGRYGGEGAVIALGSHIDTVPNGGEFDGAYGVLVGLECVRRLTEIDSFVPKTPIEARSHN